MRVIKIKSSFLFLLLSGLLIINSCKKPFDEFLNEQFPEPTSTSSDILIDGEIAVPIINTSFTLSNFIPSTDSSFWAEVDDEDLVHLRMYFKDVVSFTASQIYGMPVITPVQPDSVSASTDTSKLKLYQNALSGHLFFDDPKFTFIVKNEIPIVTFFKIDTIRLISPVYDTTYVRDHKKYNINAPTTQFETVTTPVVVDKTELPDFEDFFSPIPKYLSFFVTAGSDQVQPLPIGFPTIVGNEKISIDVDVDLPVNAHLVDFVLGENVDFSFESIENYEQIQSVTIKLIIDNEFPVSGLSQVSFADTNNEGGIDDIILNLFEGDGWEFATAITNPNGVTTSSVVSEVTIEISQEQLALLQQYHASKVIVTSKLNSYQSSTGQDVKIFGYYKLGLKLGFKVNYNGNTGDIPQ
ncbi:MAG: hypothetical protein JXR68_03170 [Bacteroidales bacterium]|nr:hypothetical protein [Bacteroidales bacterium]